MQKNAFAAINVTFAPFLVKWKSFLEILWNIFRNRNELKVPVDAVDAASIAPSDEHDSDYRKKIKYGNRIQVRSFV